MLVHLPLAGARLTALAARAGMTKQAMMKLVDGLEGLGYVERVADPDDGRAKIVRLTPAGRELLQDGLEVVRELEGEYAARLGEPSFERMKGGLRELLEALAVTMPDDVRDG